MANISFKRGSNLNNLAITDGQFIVNTAERSIYVDVGSERLRIGDFVSVANTDALPAAGGHATALYYVEDINCLAKWDGSSWIQINRDTGVKEVKVEGTGNAITAASYDATTRILTLTKGATYMTAADVDGKISDKVGTLKIGDTTYDTVVAYVNKKAEDTLSAAQGGSSETAASVKQALDNYKTENDAKVQANADAIKAIQDDYLKDTDKQALQASIDEKAAQSDLTALENKVGTVPTDKTVVGLISEAKTQADKGVTDAAAAKAAADAAQSDVDTLEGKVGTVPDGKTVVQMIADAQTAATYDDTALKNRVSTIEGDYLKAADKTELSNAIGAEKTRAEGIESGLRTDVNAIKADYLKAADKTELAQSIADVKSDVDTFLDAANIGGEAIDTLKEIQDYISSDGTAAAEMTNKIGALETTVGDVSSGLVKGVADNKAAIEAEVTRATGKEAELAQADTDNLAAAKKYADDAITALKIGDYAKQADLDTHTGNTDIHITAAERTKWNAAEGKAHTHTNKDLLDTYTQTEENLADAVAKKHEHANATELDKIENGDKAKWDAVVADHLVASDKTELEGKITAAQTAAESKVTELANGAVKANTDAIATINGTGDGSFAKADATLKTQLEAYTDQAESDAVATAKAYTDSLLEWGSF